MGALLRVVPAPPPRFPASGEAYVMGTLCLADPTTPAQYDRNLLQSGKIRKRHLGRCNVGTLPKRGGPAMVRRWQEGFP